MKTSEYKTYSDSNRIKDFLLPPLRGKILDNQGEALADNRNYYRVMFNPEIAKNTGDTILKLAKILNLDSEKTKNMLLKVRQHRLKRPLAVYEHLTWEEVSKVEIHTPELPAITIEVGQMRYFPMKELSPHSIGYLGPVSKAEIHKNPLLNNSDFKVGISGLEDSHDKTLRGVPGLKRMEVDAHGKLVRELSRIESVTGEDLSLTLNKNLQIFASQRLANESGAAVVMDVRNGDIISMVSTPGFDPNAFTYGISTQRWKELIEDDENPLINKAIANQYPPGSTFKLVVALAALEAGIDERETVYCPGYVVLGNRRFHCWKEEGHGTLSLVNAIMHSCNAYFYTIARKIGIEKIANMAKRMGLGQIYDLGIGNQKPGLIPDPKWKKRRFGSSWQLGDTLNSGIGQGFVLATPIQLAVMASRIASGNNVTPFITGKNTPNFSNLDIPKDHMQLVREGMRRVSNVPGGTAFGSRLKNPKFKIAGKTGTSQVVSKKFVDEKLEDLPLEEQKKFQNHALFVGFAPFNDPKYAISVVVEHGGGGSKAAAPVARDIMDELLKNNS